MKTSEIALILGAVAVFFFMEAANRPDAQEWSLKRSGDPGKVQLTLEVRRTTPGGRSHRVHSRELPWPSLRGLRAESLDRLRGDVEFDLVRDAGTLRCLGRAGSGRLVFAKAAGTFRFEPNPAYAGKLAELGYAAPSEGQFLTMALHDVTLEYAQTIAGAGLHASTRDLIDLHTHGVDAAYVEEVRSANLPELRARHLIDFRNHGVKTEFLRGLRGAGFEFSPREIVELAGHGVSSEFILDLASSGYTGISAAEIRDLRNHGVGGDDLRPLRRLGLQPAPKELITLKNHGVRPEFLHAIRSAGHDKLPVDEVVRLHDQGVSVDFLRQAHDLGYRFSTGDLIRLRNHGVDGAYLRKLKDAGFHHLPADQITRLRDHGVD